MKTEFWFCLGSAGIGLAVAMVAVAISQLHDDLKKILQRWAALDNLGLFPASKEPTFPRPSDLSDPQMGEGRHG